MSVMVIQMGARRNYIYAQQLEKAGLLHSLVTGLAWPSHRISAGARFLSRLSPRFAGAIARRSVAEVPPEKIKSSFLPQLVHRSLFFKDMEERFIAEDETLALLCKIRGIQGAKVVVNYIGNGGSFLEEAKRGGAKIATDFICMPTVLEIEEEEGRRWPGWGATSISHAARDLFKARIRRLLTISDIYLCPSLSVAGDLGTFAEFRPERVRLTPYGAGGFASPMVAPKPGRVLFAGACLPRKGLPYLGLAATLLRKSSTDIKIVAAGEVSPVVPKQPEVADITFLGKLDRIGMQAELAQADVFCLPSLTEGSSSAVFEALACGLPVVTTASSGSVVADGVDGFIVPERDPFALSDALRMIVEDRALRARMSQAALAKAEQYSDEACGAAFVAVMRELLEA